MAQLRGNGVLIVWVDIAAEAKRDADRWYVDEHLPERIVHAGYLRARRFVAVRGDPEYMSIFEAQTPQALANEGYARITSRINPRSHRIRAAFTRCIRSTHRRLLSFGDAEGMVTVCCRFKFTTKKNREEYETWAMGQFEPWARAHEAVVAGHALTSAMEVRRHMDQFRETGQNDEWTEGVLLVELIQDTDADQQLLQSLSRTGLARAGVNAVEVETGIYRNMVSFSL